MENFSTRDLIIETVNKLFVYTDLREWNKLQDEVFAGKVLFDMSSMGGEKTETTPQHICDIWATGFEGIDVVNHLAGNYLVQINKDTASVFAYATATHYKASATNGTTRQFIGTYTIGLIKMEYGWRIDQFTYHLRFANGNTDLS